MLPTSSFNQTHVLVGFKQYFSFLLGRENIHNYCIKSIASSHYLIKSNASSRCALKILREILSFTRSFMINTHPLVECLETSHRKVKQFRVIPRIASSRLIYCSSIHFPNLNVSASLPPQISIEGCLDREFIRSKPKVSSVEEKIAIEE